MASWSLHIPSFEIVQCCIAQRKRRTNFYTSTAMGTTPGSRAICFPGARISFPCQNLGSSLPGTNSLSTLSSVITHMRITPPDEPSRDIASASAVQWISLVVDGGQRTENALFLTNSTVSSLPHPSWYVASQYPYTYVDPEPKGRHQRGSSLDEATYLRSPMVGGRAHPREEYYIHSVLLPCPIPQQ